MGIAIHGKQKGSAQKETLVVPATMRTRSSLPAPEPQTKSDGKILRKDSLSEAGVRLGRGLEDRAKTASVGHSRTFGVILGILPSVRITEQNRDANSVKSALLCTERLTVSPTNDRTNTITITMTITMTITIKIRLELDLELKLQLQLQQQHKPFARKSALFPVSPLQTASAVDVMMDVDSVSAARRRRERRLRQFLRHERLSVAMALSEKKHHTSRGQRKDRAGVWVRDVLHGQVPGAPTPEPELFQLYEEEPGNSRPPCLGEPRGATGEGPAVHRRAARRRRTYGADSGHSWVAGGDQVVVVLWKLDVPAVEQVIVVPLISLDRVPQRSASRRPQKAEQLVEVPTEPGYPLAVLAVRALGRRAATALAEQTVDNPVPQGRRGGGGGLQGLRAGQGSTAADVEQIFDIPVPQGRRKRSGSPQGFLPGKNSSANVSRSLICPHRVDFFKMRIEDLKGFLALYPSPKKVRRLPASRVRECPPVAAHPS